MPLVETDAAAGPGVAVVRINNPERRNALDAATRRELLGAFDALRAAPVRAVVVTGTGPTFAAGADLRETAARTPQQQREFISRPRMYEAVEEYPKPVVAAINGHALGAGLELAMACDVRVAAVDAKLGQPEIRLGLIPGGGGTQRLPRLVGMGRALEMVLSGEAVTGEQALAMGLVNRAVPRESVLEASVALAASMARWSPMALAEAKAATRAAWREPLEAGLDQEIDAFMRAFVSEDAKEGVQAFLDKREPVFKGR